MHYDGPTIAMATARPDDLHRSVTNLVENAVRFGAEVDDPARMSADQARPSTSRTTAPAFRMRASRTMLEPFVRGDDARNMDEATGFGLGLSIARAIALAHGGALSLHDRQPHGLIVRMQLPVRQQPRLGGVRSDVSVKCRAKRQAASGRSRSTMRFVEDRNRLEAIVAGAAIPEISDVRPAPALDPVRLRDRLAALGTRISTGQIAGI